MRSGCMNITRCSKRDTPTSLTRMSKPYPQPRLGAVTGGSDTTSTQWNAIMKTKTCVWQGCHVTSSTPGSPGWVYYTEIVAPIAPEGLYCPVHSAWIETQAYGDWEEIQGSRMRSLQ